MAAATAVKANAQKRLIIIIASIVAAALVVAGAGFGTYKAQLWGGKTVPKPADLGVVKSSKTHEFTASDVEQSLHKRGFKTTTKQTFSGKPKGSFIKYSNIDPNKRYSTGDPITVFASSGPGVPKGTQGQQVRKIRKSISDMNVPVHFHKVVVTNQKTAPDTVVASYPADGQPVTDTKTGINIGVAEQAKGVGYDVVGQDKDQARQQYASAGFNVTLKPRFSSKARLGKIVDSSPKPGSEANGGNLTLYYGIDASGFKDAVIGKNAYPDDPYGSPNDLVGSAAPVAGKYCTNAGDCIDFTNPSDSGQGMPATISSEFPSQGSKDFGKDLLFCGSVQQAYCPTENDLQSLYTKGSGAFELAPYQMAVGFECGGIWQEDGGCINGKTIYTGDPGFDSPMSGANYDMGPLYIYFPVGSDVSKVTGANYFDNNELAKAQKQKAVDTSRPFFIRRDKKLYDKTSVPVTTFDTPNPFAPTFAALNGQKLEPFKPAPSDETAYYLVEDPQLDWGSLPDYVFSDGNNDGKKTESASKDASPNQILAAMAKGDFTPIAGSYCLSSGECMQLSKQGVLTGVSKDYDMIAHEGSHLSFDNTSNGSAGTTYSAKRPFFFLTGPDSEYTCDGGVGLSQCADVQMNQMATTPTKLLYVFKGADTSAWYKENDQSIENPGFLFVAGADDPTQAPTDRPYLVVMNSHSTTSTAPPHPDDVYYLKE
ncbi:PASTA domain-containing protein [Bifidobacterium sp. ESL0775]|uniref:PASTA domain-containing protein n=1 Tax=Bifidobacterium sp. ESL0775 TaxID=2983230 RepID=UPI0023F7A5C2|nr:PASTA domain-containing protein [Bifidobacterium sp. ESL0775]WEV69452.1 PASTA domain-containing protein [Bifidobacterium sp. ESL0775]